MTARKSISAMPNIKLKYFGYHPYNNPTHSERNVELSIAFWYLKYFEHDLQNLIEVGEVTPFYYDPRHLVIDVAAEKPATVKKDAADVEYCGKHLLSISTIEHIGTRDYGQTPDPARLPLVISKMLASKDYLITFALGYNPQLEDLIKDEHYFVLERIASTKWRQTENRDLKRFKYNSPWFAGNAVCILTNLQNFQFEFTRRNFLSVASRYRAADWSWKNFVRETKQEISDGCRIHSPPR
jgi:hypothetical protein